MESLSSWEFPKISRANYVVLREPLLKAMLEFGPPGAAIYQGVEYLPPVEPSPENRIYPKDKSGELTSFGGQMYFRDLDNFAKVQAANVVHCQRGIFFLWRIIAPDTESAMKVHVAEYDRAKASLDLPAMVALLERVLLTSSEANQHNQFIKLVEMKMGNLTPEAFFAQHDAQFAVVKAHVESAQHPGYMSLDAMRKGLLLNAVDQTFFKTVIDQVHDATPAPTAAEVKVKLHAYALRHWDAAHAPADAPPSPATKALVASTPSSGPGSAVGPYNPALHSMCCSFCWSQGYRNTTHLVGACKFKAYAARRAARGAQAHASVALPPAALPVAAPAADTLLVQQFEGMFQSYVSA